MSGQSVGWIKKVLCLLAFFVLALVPRLYSAQTVGWHWDSPGSFTLVNFDEGGSCRAALKGFDYSPFIGYQTVAITEALGHPVPPGVKGDEPAAKRYCHSVEHIQVARAYAAVTGALTVVVLAVMALLLVPSRPQIAWTAAALLALSGFHVSESHSGTVDAPSVLFIYLFLTLMVFAVRRERPMALFSSPLLLVPAIWSKYWVFAISAYVVLLSQRLWQYLCLGMSGARVALLFFATVVMFAFTSNEAFQSAGLYPWLALYYLLVPWRRVNWPVIILLASMPLIAVGLGTIELVAAFTTGELENRFGTGYAAIGWNKWLRNPLNVFMVLLVGLGLPACLFIPAGVRAIIRDGANARPWLCLFPLLLFFAFMMFISPVTYYRHYLPLIPAAALVAAVGLWSTAWSARPGFMLLFFIWPALLMVDLDMDYHKDPRVALRGWYSEHAGDTVLIGYYVNPPPSGMANSRLFQPEYAVGDAASLRQADYLILSENWYDTAFANELNGPYIDKPERLIKTRPEYVRFYRDALSGQHRYLQLDQALDVGNFMPELVFHRWYYGTFQMFVGDLKIFRIIK
ncbi:MAG: hypothetical protein V7746_24230 [Halioglobus sp.]